jgi:hypothetical protein
MTDNGFSIWLVPTRSGESTYPLKYAAAMDQVLLTDGRLPVPQQSSESLGVWWYLVGNSTADEAPFSCDDTFFYRFLAMCACANRVNSLLDRWVKNCYGFVLIDYIQHAGSPSDNLQLTALDRRPSIRFVGENSCGLSGCHSLRSSWQNLGTNDTISEICMSVGPSALSSVTKRQKQVAGARNRQEEILRSLFKSQQGLGLPQELQTQILIQVVFCICVSRMLSRRPEYMLLGSLKTDAYLASVM